MRERELKPLPWALSITGQVSLPMRERELKRYGSVCSGVEAASLPMRERELKLGRGFILIVRC